MGSSPDAKCRGSGLEIKGKGEFSELREHLRVGRTGIPMCNNVTAAVKECTRSHKKKKMPIFWKITSVLALG